jgi:hypothetical protein
MFSKCISSRKDYFLVADTVCSGQSASFAYGLTVMAFHWLKLFSYIWPWPIWPVTSKYWVLIGQLLWKDKLSHPPRSYLTLLSFWLYNTVSHSWNVRNGNSTRGSAFGVNRLWRTYITIHVISDTCICITGNYVWFQCMSMLCAAVCMCMSVRARVLLVVVFWRCCPSIILLYFDYSHALGG